MQNDPDPVTDGLINDSNSVNDIDIHHEENLRDRFKATYILFYVLGVLSQIPANFFITANDYWMYKFRDPDNSSFIHTNDSSRTKMQTSFTSTYSIVASVTTVGAILMTVPLLKKINIKNRVVISFSIFMAAFLVTLLFVEIDTDSWQLGFFILTMITGAFLTGGSGMFLITLFQMASKFPARYLAVVFSGQAICGILAALTQIISLAVGAKPLQGAFIYFSIGSFFVLSTWIIFHVVYTKSVYFRYNLHKEVEEVKMHFTRQQLLGILNKIKWYLGAMIIVIGSTIVINPSVTSLVVSLDKGHGHKWNDLFFVPVTTFFLFHLFDLIGREMSAIIQRPSNDLVLLSLGVLRVIMIPMLMFCNAQPRKHLPVYFDDFAYIVIIIVFSYTNGYLVNMCILQLPKKTLESEKNVAYLFILVFMILVLAGFSFLNILIIKAL